MSREIEQRLYVTPPARFIAARDEAVAAAREAGDAAAAREIARLRRPTVAAWLVNLLAIERPELIADLVGLSSALRAAQRDLRGGQLRELSTARLSAVNSLVAAARELARRADPGMAAGKLPLAEVEATLNAALSDEQIAGEVRSGRLIRPVSYAGFGEVPRPQLRLVTEDTDEPERPARPPSGPDRRAGQPAAATKRQPARKPSAAEAREDSAKARADSAAKARAVAKERAVRRRVLARELAAARTDQEQAETDLRRCEQAHHDGEEALARADAELAEARRRRIAADQEVTRRKAARKAAERAAAVARRRTGDVEAALEAHDAEPETVGKPGRTVDSGR